MEPPAMNAGPKSLSAIRIRTRVRRDLQRVGGDQGERGPGAGPDVGRGDPHGEGAVRLGGDGRRGRRGARRVGRPRPCRCRAASARRGARPGRGSRSAQPNRRAPSSKQAIRLRLLNGSPDAGPDLGFVADAQRDRVQAGLLGELVHRRLDARTSRAPQPGARMKVGVGTSSRTTLVRVRCASASYMARPGRALCSTNSWTVEVRARRPRGRARAAARRRPRRAGPAAPSRAAVPDEREHLPAGEDDADRPVEHGRGHHREHQVRRVRPLDPKAPPTCSDRTRTEAGSRENSSARSCATAWEPWLESTTSSRPLVPARHRRMRLHRAVVLLGRGVLLVHDHGGRGELGLDVALLRHPAARPRGPPACTCRGGPAEKTTSCGSSS